MPQQLWRQQQQQQQQSSPSLHHPHPTPTDCNENQVMHEKDSQAHLQESNGYNSGSGVGKRFDPHDAASYLLQEELIIHHSHPRYKYKNNTSQSNSSQLKKRQLPQVVPPIQRSLVSASEYSYEWDPTNLNRLLSMRNQMKCALFSTENSSCRRLHHRHHHRASECDKKTAMNKNDNTLVNHDRQEEKGGNNNIIHSDNIDVDDCGGIWCSHPNFFASPSSSSAATAVTTTLARTKKEDKANTTKVKGRTGWDDYIDTDTTNTTTTAMDKCNTCQDNNDHDEKYRAVSSIIWNELLPLPKDYFSYAIRYLLMDTPLPLVDCCSCIRHSSTPSSKNIMKTIHPHLCRLHEAGVVIGGGDSTSSGNSSCSDDGESIYLIPRYYLLRWMNWARCTIIHSAVKCWFAAWENHDDDVVSQERNHQRTKSKLMTTEQSLVDGDVHDMRRRDRRQNEEMSSQHKQSRQRKQQQQHQQQKRIFSLPSETLKALAALSLLSEQYALCTNTENDFTDWMSNVEHCWNNWNRMVGKHRTWRDQHSQRQQQAQQPANSKLEEECGNQIKEGEWNGIENENPSPNGENYKQHLQHSTLTNGQQQPSPQDPTPPPMQIPMPYPYFTFPVFQPPGPVDSRMLSTRSNPLIMHRHVALSMRGILNSNCVTTPELAGDARANVHGCVSLLTPAEDASETTLMSFINDSLWVSHDDQAIAAQSKQQLAVVPVPTSFYELLRSVHGVYSNDGDVSYSPPLSIVNTPHHAGSRRDVSSGKKYNGNRREIVGRERGSQKVGRDENAKYTTHFNDSHSSSLLPTSSLLFHDQWKICDDVADNTQNTQSKKNPHLDHRMDNNHDLYQGYHPLYFSNDPHTASSNSKSSHQQLLCRSIEFRRQVLPVLLHEVGDESLGDEDPTKSFSSVATQSPYSKAMQQAMKSKKTYDAVATSVGSGEGGANSRSDTNIKERTHTGNDINIAGYAVEAFPVEFFYTIVDGDATPNPPVSTATTSGKEKKGARKVSFKLDSDRHGINSHQGIALVSRRSSAFAVLRDLQQAAMPSRAQTCVRLWIKSPCQNATGKGDGYDLLDDTSLCAAPAARLPPAPRSGGVGAYFSTPSTQSHLKSIHDTRHQSQLTVEQWLGLEPLSATTINEKKVLFYDGISETPARVELLVEIRRSPSSKWVREPLEFAHRLQIGDYVDAQDSTRKWYEAIVRDIKLNSVRVHYFGWGSKWDADLPRWSGSGSKLSPPVPLWTRTAKWREQINEGDEVEIRESTSLVQRPKWHRATVLLVGGENDIPRELDGGAELEMIDVNSRRVPLMLLSLKRQVLVEVPQEMHNLPAATPLAPTTHGIPAAQPPFRRWVNLYGEEICNVNTHKNVDKKMLNLPATLKYTLESERAPVEVMRSFNNSHGSGFVRESLRGLPPAIGTVGLHNLGNTCYMNSILQCINHIKPITQYFLKGDYVKEINKHNPLGSGGRVATAYASFLSDVYSGEFSILAPRLLKHTLSCYAPQFRNNHQHDSHEFCQYLLDGLHEDLNRVKSKPYVEQLEALGLDDSEAAMISWKKHLLRHDSIFVDYTQGLHRSHLTCPRCGRESIKFDVYSSISLPLVPAKNRSSIPLSDCLDQFAAGEQLDEHNAWYCPSCKRHVCALKLITLWTTPDILVLHLKRFMFEKSPTDGRIMRSKIEDKVNFPIDRLDLTSYVLGPTDPSAPPVYKLFGVSEHTGSTANSGHYTATVLNAKDGNWYRYNDSHVGTTSGDAAVTGGAYLLFYHRANGALRWGGMEAQMMQLPKHAD